MMTTQTAFELWLARKPKGRAPKKPLPKRTKKRAAEERLYRKLAKQFLKEHMFCDVWLKQYAPALYRKPLTFKDTEQHPILWHAPLSEETHHMAKRRGALLCDTRYFLAVCSANHARIEQNLRWARKEGFSLNF